MNKHSISTKLEKIEKGGVNYVGTKCRNLFLMFAYAIANENQDSEKYKKKYPKS